MLRRLLWRFLGNRDAGVAPLELTALMLSKDAASLTNAALQTKANDYFKALFTRPEATGLVVNATYNPTPAAARRSSSTPRATSKPTSWA